ncbi:helix-turn-helix transcriptional regulator [uncultured Aquimonas sp.]|uniref:helix-turn-helix domain-containing protein n=1 Tax=uncultured Aquimonas sp. TaxID=385483 RepID=UPI00262DEE1E|nr:helix-turn-helix transcriptional regulator [uncultured Aquimonas sp.]
MSIKRCALVAEKLRITYYEWQAMLGSLCAPSDGDRALAAPAAPPLFAQRLRQARERAGLTQQKLGILVGLDESVAGPRINQYENGVHQPRQEMLLELARVLDIPAAYLVTSDELLARLLLAWPRLSEAERIRVLALVEG